MVDVNRQRTKGKSIDGKKFLFLSMREDAKDYLIVSLSSVLWLKQKHSTVDGLTRLRWSFSARRVENIFERNMQYNKGLKGKVKREA